MDERWADLPAGVFGGVYDLLPPLQNAEGDPSRLHVALACKAWGRASAACERHVRLNLGGAEPQWQLEAFALWAGRRRVASLDLTSGTKRELDLACLRGGHLVALSIGVNTSVELASLGRLQSVKRLSLPMPAVAAPGYGLTAQAYDAFFKSIEPERAALFQAVDASLQELSQLEHLDLLGSRTYGLAMWLPPWCCMLTYHVPACWEGLTRLTSLQLACNGLSQVPSSALPLLRELRVLLSMEHDENDATLHAQPWGPHLTLLALQNVKVVVGYPPALRHLCLVNVEHAPPLTALQGLTEVRLFSVGFKWQALKLETLPALRVARLYFWEPERVKGLEKLQHLEELHTQACLDNPSADLEFICSAMSDAPRPREPTTNTDVAWEYELLSAAALLPRLKLLSFSLPAAYLRERNLQAVELDGVVSDALLKLDGGLASRGCRVVRRGVEEKDHQYEDEQDEAVMAGEWFMGR